MAGDPQHLTITLYPGEELSRYLSFLAILLHGGFFSFSSPIVSIGRGLPLLQFQQPSAQQLACAGDRMEHRECSEINRNVAQVIQID